jgi:hypothetical protein
MKDELKDLIDQEFDKLNPSTDQKENIEKSIQEIIENQNKQVQEEATYRKKLFEILEKLEKMNIPVKYNDSMTTKELEKIIKEVNL